MIDKSISQAPGQNLEQDSPDIEIEVVNPEAMKVGIDGIEIDIEPGDDTEGSEDFDSNLADFMDDSALQSIASDLLDLVDADVNSRKDWVDSFVKGLEVLGMKYEGWCMWCLLHLAYRSSNPVPSRDDYRDIPRSRPSQNADRGRGR
jgi:hypothetical protein